MPTIRITWTDSTSPGVLGTKIYRDDVEIGDVGNGVETFDDTVSDGTYKYEVQAYSATDETTQEVIGVNVETISTLEPAPTNFVFDGQSTSYMFDDAVKTILDGVVEQSWVYRYKRRINGWQHGVVGAENHANALKIEIDAADDRCDCSLSDTGVTSFTNAVVSLDGDWHIGFLTYGGGVLKIYEDGVYTKEDVGDFSGRQAGRTLTVGATAIPSATPGFLDGEMSDVQFYSKELSQAEITALNNDLTNIPTSGLIANFAGNKTTNGALAGQWISEDSGTHPSYVLENKGTVTFN